MRFLTQKGSLKTLSINNFIKLQMHNFKNCLPLSEELIFGLTFLLFHQSFVCISTPTHDKNESRKTLRQLWKPKRSGPCFLSLLDEFKWDSTTERCCCKLNKEFLLIIKGYLGMTTVIRLHWVGNEHNSFDIRLALEIKVLHSVICTNCMHFYSIDGTNTNRLLWISLSCRFRDFIIALVFLF